MFCNGSFLAVTVGREILAWVSVAFFSCIIPGVRDTLIHCIDGIHHQELYVLPLQVCSAP